MNNTDAWKIYGVFHFANRNGFISPELTFPKRSVSYKISFSSNRYNVIYFFFIHRIIPSKHFVDREFPFKIAFKCRHTLICFANHHHYLHAKWNHRSKKNISSKILCIVKMEKPIEYIHIIDSNASQIFWQHITSLAVVNKSFLTFQRIFFIPKWQKWDIAYLNSNIIRYIPNQNVNFISNVFHSIYFIFKYWQKDFYSWKGLVILYTAIRIYSVQFSQL